MNSSPILTILAELRTMNKLIHYLFVIHQSFGYNMQN